MKTKILIALGIASMLGAIFMAIKSTKEGCEESKKKQKKRRNKDPVEKIAIYLYMYAPTIFLTIISLTCFTVVHKDNLRRGAAIMTSYKIASSTYNKYKKKTKELVGETQEEKIRRGVAKDILDKDYSLVTAGKKKVIVTSPDDNETIFYDYISKRFFRSSFTKMRGIERDLNELSKREFCIPLNEFYRRANLKPTQDGKELGWNSMYNEIRFKYYTGAQIDGEICVLLSFECAPGYDYMDL